MGLFCLPEESIENSTAMQLVEAAEQNIALWKTNQSCEYLLDSFATTLLKDAAKKVRANSTPNV
jgi:hypothetical protein